MTSRERDIGRKYPSGSEKNKRKRELTEQRNKLLQKMPKLTIFFSTAAPSAVHDDATSQETPHCLQPCSSSGTNLQEQRQIVPDLALAALSNDLGSGLQFLHMSKKGNGQQEAARNVNI